MMKVALHVDYSDGSGVDVEATAPDLIAFERNFDKPFTVFAENLRLEYLVWLAWQTLKRQGKTSLEFDPWIETVGGIALGEAVDPVPLESKAPTGS
jgi:hypothetical protein